MSSKRRKKKNNRVQGSNHIKQPSCSSLDAIALSEETEESNLSTEQVSTVEKESPVEDQETSEPSFSSDERPSEEAEEHHPDQKDSDPPEEDTLEAPEEETEAEEICIEEFPEKEETKENTNPVLAKGKDIFHTAARHCSQVWGNIKPSIKKWHAEIQKYVRKFYKYFQNIKLSYRIAGFAALGVALFTVLLVGIFSWEWFGLVIHQRPVAGTWLMEQTEPATYLTLQEDGTVIVTTDGLNVKGNYNILENDILCFDVSAGNMDVWAGDFKYWATDTGLTLTRISTDSEQDPELAIENVLQFEKQESDITQPAGIETPIIDENLLGSWTDESETVTYTFQQDGSLMIDFRGAYYNAVYTAQDGVLDITTYIPGSESREESNPYTIEENMLSFSNMELFKDAQ